MKIRMRETHRSTAPDGIKEEEYKKGKTYDLPLEDAQRFINKRWATFAKGEKPQEPSETKVEEVPETKTEEPDETKEK